MGCTHRHRLISSLGPYLLHVLHPSASATQGPFQDLSSSKSSHDIAFNVFHIYTYTFQCYLKLIYISHQPPAASIKGPANPSIKVSSSSCPSPHLVLLLFLLAWLPKDQAKLFSHGSVGRAGSLARRLTLGLGTMMQPRMTCRSIHPR
jgi:hypothetical protein